MTIARPLLFSSAFLLGLAGAVQAESLPRPVQADERIRTVPFQKDNIIYLAGMMGVSTMIVFHEDEKIATVAMGDSIAWQAVPDQSKQFLFIKPLQPDAETNMNVVTSRRVYNFMLKGAKPGNTKQAVIKLRFAYPDDVGDAKLLALARQNAAMPNVQAALANPGRLNYDYGYKGAVDNRPASMFDDGKKTFFQFSGEVPSFFAVKSDGSESLVNFRREGDYIVVDKVSRQWTLRNGSIVTCVFNLRNRPTRPETVRTAQMSGDRHDR
ncbi:TrbG/VirB9 family P-type conjugative transfer protein [Agrobacterium tumefaciens]|uniref:TrbG/VirB9 family P-type conjugative transfer protein n=1 Tax=Agrobacterium tumefaciens TaxID=358 RepID=UPI0015720DD4|nr:TrbG/VirB9 family P-type conjugative transfer protein [Agrobacterium tumefaciens]